MAKSVTLHLWPLGKELRLAQDASLLDALFEHGVEFPCGGKGLCKGCKIRVRKGDMAISREDREKLSSSELAEGWRLACTARAESDLHLELAQWETAILSDSTTFQFTASQGLGIAVDIGTTTVVAQLVNLVTGNVLAVRSALNAQAKHGADIMTRVEFATTPEGRAVLRDGLRNQVGVMVSELLHAAQEDSSELRHVVLVGNTVMHHLFSDIDCEPLSRYPFEPVTPGMQSFSGTQLGWKTSDGVAVHFLPCFGGFVGSDILAGVLATGLHRSEAVSALIDLGTNGEIVVGNCERALCTSTAAGPAFEGARISMGMRAATGAISEVRIRDGSVQCHVIGNTEPRGICGSGLVDAAAAGLDLGWINPRGRLICGENMALSGTVTLTQWDIRELQLAKGAIAAGLRVLCERWGTTEKALSCVYLAGAFGNYINYASARRIGLLNFPQEKVVPSGNTALLGAKIALFDIAAGKDPSEQPLNVVRNLSLKEDPGFQDAYIQSMPFS